jgi:sugar phosphate isomerase/epimerase
VPWGDGEVNTDAFLRALDEAGFSGAIAVEREAGTQRSRDVAQAIERLANWKK